MTRSSTKVSKNVTIFGTGELAKKVGQLSEKNQETIARVLHQGARTIAEDAKSSMALSPPDGEVYGDHVASSAGNPPRIDTGDLANAVTTKPLQYSAGVEETVVGVFEESGQGEKAVWLEFGTQNIDERPFLRPSYLRNRAQILKNVKKAVKRQTEQIARQ